jgi:hypothetical protein
VNKYFAVLAICAMLLLSTTLAGCGDNGSTNDPVTSTNTTGEVTGIENGGGLLETIVIPKNLEISVTGRLMTVTWDSVPYASGYIIYTTSTGCGSGNKIVNTENKTATNHKGEEIKSEIAEKGITTNGSGFVTFTGETSFTICLMTDPQQENVPMATALTAKIMAVGDDNNYLDSAYSEIITLEKSDYLPQG